MMLTWRAYPLTLREPLRISRSTMAGRDAVEVCLSHDGLTGHGEVVTSTYFGLDRATIDMALTTLREQVAGCPDPETLLVDLPPAAPAVLAALDAATHDLVGKRQGAPVHRLLGTPHLAEVPTAYTIGLIPPADAAATARRLTRAGFAVLKVKAGDAYDAARIAAVCAAAPGARLLVDPNGGWNPEGTMRLLDTVAACDIAAVEQPIPPGTPDRLAWISARTAVPIVADEDAATLADVDRLVGAVAGINIKLAKCGGVRAALGLVDAAARHGMDVMLGCLVASSLGIAPAVHLTGPARWVDLDGHLLLADDPWTGIGGHDGTLTVPTAPGLGVRRVVRR
jgi:L-alanine-DL-glutamate epimerase-like enolase superfamily enzyme